MIFVTQQDLESYLSDTRLSQIVQGNANALDDSEEFALDTVKSSLFERFDWDTILTDKPKLVLGWVIMLMVYHLYKRVPGQMTPPRIVKDYDDVLAILVDVERGKKPLDLPRINKPDSDLPITRFRWGSNTKRSH